MLAACPPTLATTYHQPAHPAAPSCGALGVLELTRVPIAALSFQAAVRCFGIDARYVAVEQRTSHAPMSLQLLTARCHAVGPLPKVHDVFDSEEDSDCSSVSSSSGSSTLRRRSVTRTGSRITFRPPRSSGTPSRCRNRQEMRRSMLARCSKPRTCEHCGVRFPSGNALFRHLAAGCSADGGSHGDARTRSSARGSAPRASARAPAAAPSMEPFIRMDEPHGLGELEGYEYRSGELGMGCEPPRRGCLAFRVVGVTLRVRVCLGRYYCLGAAPAAAQAAPQDTSLRTLLRSTEGRRGRSGSLFARRRAALAATTTRHSPPPAVRGTYSMLLTHAWR